MTVYETLFYLFAGVMVASAIFVVTTRNIIYAGFSLLCTFFCVAALYVFAKADFIAVTQLIVYVGGILVLLLFGVMLTNRVSSDKISTDVINILPGFLISAAVFVTLVRVISQTDFSHLAWIKQANDSQNILQPADSTLRTIGIQTMTGYLLPFEVVSILLLIALIGAAYISRREPPRVRKLK